MCAYWLERVLVVWLECWNVCVLNVCWLDQVFCHNRKQTLQNPSTRYLDSIATLKAQCDAARQVLQWKLVLTVSSNNATFGFTTVALFVWYYEVLPCSHRQSSLPRLDALIIQTKLNRHFKQRATISNAPSRNEGGRLQI